MAREPTRSRIRNSSIRWGSTARAPAPRSAVEPTECNRTASPNWTILFTPATLFGTFSHPVVIASSTEDDYFDLFIAVQAPSASSSNSLLSGTFTVGTLDFLNSSCLAGAARLLHFERRRPRKYRGIHRERLVAKRQAPATTLTQNVSASTYALSGAAGGTLTFPGSLQRSERDRQRRKGFCMCQPMATGSWQARTSGSDMFFGFRAPSGTSSNSTLERDLLYGGHGRRC